MKLPYIMYFHNQGPQFGALKTRIEVYIVQYLLVLQAKYNLNVYKVFNLYSCFRHQYANINKGVQLSLENITVI